MRKLQSSWQLLGFSGGKLNKCEITEPWDILYRRTSYLSNCLLNVTALGDDNILKNYAQTKGHHKKSQPKGGKKLVEISEIFRQARICSKC